MVYIIYTDYQNPDEERYDFADNIMDARAKAVRQLERTRHTVYISQVDKYNKVPIDNIHEVS